MPRQRYSRPEPFRSKQKPLRWMGEWHVYERNADGSERRRHRGPIVLGYCSEMTKSEAQAELDRRIADDRAPRDQKVPGPVTLEWSIRQHLHLGSGHWEAETTWTNKSVAKHALKALGAIPLAEVTREHIQEFLNALAASKSKSTVRKVKNLLAGVFADALEDGKVSRNPMRKVKMPKCRESCKRYLTEAECAQLLGAAEGRDHLILRLCMVTGLRPGEVFAARRDDVEPGRLRIDEASRNGAVKKPKTDASVGYVPLPPSLEAELRWWLDHSPIDATGLIFPSERPGKPIRQNNYLKRNLAAIAKRAGLAGVTFQSFRRTTATHAQKIGTVKDHQALMRHASPEMSVGVYMQEIPDSVRGVADALDAKLCGKVQ